MATADVFICLRSPKHPEWQQIKEQYPVGMIIEEARLLSLTHRGMMVEIGDGDHRVVGLLPWYQYGPPFAREVGECENAPVPLQVVGYSDDRCVIIFGLDPYISLRWTQKKVPTVGQRVAVHVSSWSELPSVCLWDLGCQATCAAGPPEIEGWVWGRVSESNAATRTLKIDPGSSTHRTYTRTAKRHGHSVVFEDGTRAYSTEIISKDFQESDAATSLLGVKVISRELLPVIRVISKATEIVLADLKQCIENGLPISVRVFSVTKGGWLAEVLPAGLLHGDQIKILKADRITAFLPRSQADHSWRANEKKLVGEVLRAKVLKLQEEPLNIVVSQKKLATSENMEAFEKIRQGDVFTGTVKSICDYGAFVSIGNLDGLLHRDDISYKRIKSRKEIESILSDGQNVRVQVLKVDREKSRFWLGMKQLQSDPRTGAASS